MKQLIFKNLVLLTLLSIYSCKTYQPNNLPSKQIIFGNGGGITGATTSYILLQNGQVFKSNSLQNDTTALLKIKPKIAKQYFEQLNDLDWQKVGSSQPGNTYQFVTYKTVDSTQRIAWGAAGYEVPTNLKNIYDALKKELIEE
ncbi:MAG: hypothetical protein AAGG68_02905 [Bacteroidota bacterium]